MDHQTEIITMAEEFHELILKWQAVLGGDGYALSPSHARDMIEQAFTAALDDFELDGDEEE